jgi:hypothetical protein
MIEGILLLVSFLPSDQIGKPVVTLRDEVKKCRNKCSLQ